MKNKITVNLKSCKYDIVVSQNHSDFISQFQKVAKTKTLFVITDKNVEKLHLKFFVRLLLQNGFFNVKHVSITPGEIGKSIETLSFLYDKALASSIDRKSCVVALGGGVVGDIAGFFAASYMRGIDFIQIPTTLLAMTDSSVGGKTAINTKGGKNTAGAFYQPKLVWINSKFLETLPVEHTKNGLAEIIKYAFIFDRKFYDFLLNILRSEISLKNFDYLIFKSCSYKANVVEKDEKEITGIRAVLNFGHTFAHALETATKYKKFLHGQAVAIGMLFATQLSLDMKICKLKVLQEIEEILKNANFNLKIKFNPSFFLVLMKKDKKAVDGNIKFVLIREIGKTLNCDVKDSDVLKTLRKFSN
ncbi:MAG: 3-dehydroquinate synthase [Elusimicrobiota bacterium]|nr:3-dehydroquinate synthase [Elusimicrobiota bacterium]